MKTSSSASKKVGEASRLPASHRRLLDALNLGRTTRGSGKKGQLWHFPDFGIQKLVLHSMDSFLDCISMEISQHPLVKDSVEDMVGALESILECRSESMLELASDVAKRMVNVLPSSVLQSHASRLVRPLSSLLCSRNSQVAISCANAVTSILSTLSTKQEAEVWEILREQNAVECLVDNVKKFSIKDDPVDYIHETVILLSKILWFCPPSRFCIWTDSILLDILDKLIFRTESSLKVAVLQCYSGLALCGHGANKLLENGSSVTQMMLDCMNNSCPDSMRAAAFKLAQCLMISELGRKEVLKVCCKPLVNGIVDAMKDHNLHPRKFPGGKVLLIEEVCRLALITRWAGDHHTYFWKEGICCVLLDLLLNEFDQTQQSLQHISIQKKISVLQGCMNKSIIPALKPYIWDIIGGLVANCAEDLDLDLFEAKDDLSLLTTCACLVFVESANGVKKTSQHYNTNTSGSESAARAVLLMLYSPCEYIASQSRSILSEILKLDAKCVVKSLGILASCRQSFAMPSIFQMVISSICLACCASLAYYRRFLCQNQVISTLLSFLKWLLENPISIKRSNIARHLHSPMSERSCCSFTEDWEGNDMLLLFSLCALNELIQHSSSPAGFLDIKVNMDESQLVRELQDIYNTSSSLGSRWYAAFILCRFGQYGFPSKLGRKMREALLEVESADLRLILRNNEILHVHKAIIMARCPSLLPSEDRLVKEKSTTVGPETEESTHVTDIRMSAHVDHQTLLKLLEYIYSGYFLVDTDLLRRLKVLVKHCNLQPLLQMFSRQNPKWGTPIPKFDLVDAIGPDGYNTSDLLLKSDTTELPHWSCTSCSVTVTVPHLHVHKVVLWSSCNYLRAMFHSGMQESTSQSLKVPVSWNSLVKLVTWFYSDDVPKITFGCLWNNMDVSKKVSEFQPYVELCWLAEFWLLEDLYEQCFKVAIDAMEADIYLSVKAIQIAANFCQWRLVEIAATNLAPSYHQLRNSGNLDDLDENVTEMIREASVQHCKQS